MTETVKLLLLRNQEIHTVTEKIDDIFMNVLFLSQIVPYPPHGGVLQRGYNIVKEISKYNNVHLLAFIHPDVLSTEEQVEESKDALLKHCKSVEYFELWPKKSTLHKYLGFAFGLVYPLPFSFLAHKSAAFRKRVLEIVENNQIELIHYDTIALAQYLECVPNLPSVLTHHNIESELMKRRAEVETNIIAKFYLKKEVIKLLKSEAKFSPMFDLNVTMSGIDAQKLKSIAGEIKIEIVPNGTDLGYFKPVKGKESKAVIYTGGMNMYANMDAVLFFIEKIWPSIKNRIPEIVFYVIGQDPPAELNRLAEREAGIKVMGYVDDVRPYVARAGVYVVPLRVGGGTRLKVVDALSQGKAIVSTSVGCEGIDVTSGLNIVIADEPDEFADQVVAILNDNERRDALSKAARELAEDKYSWESMGKDLQLGYEAIIADSRTMK